MVRAATFENTCRLGRRLFPFARKGRRVQRARGMKEFVVLDSSAAGGVGAEEEEVGRERQGQIQRPCTWY